MSYGQKQKTPAFLQGLSEPNQPMYYISLRISLRDSNIFELGYQKLCLCI